MCVNILRDIPCESPTLHFCSQGLCWVTSSSPQTLASEELHKKLSEWSFKWTSQHCWLGQLPAIQNYYTESHQGEFGEFWILKKHIINPTALGHDPKTRYPAGHLSSDKSALSTLIKERTPSPFQTNVINSVILQFESSYFLEHHCSVEIRDLHV